MIPEVALDTPQTRISGKRRRSNRRYERLSVRCGCWLEHEQATVFGNTVDLAEGGLFLRTALPMPAGSEVRVVLQLPGRKDEVVATGTIARSVGSRADSRPGLGVEFSELKRGARALAAFLGHSLKQL